MSIEDSARMPSRRGLSLRFALLACSALVVGLLAGGVAGWGIAMTQAQPQMEAQSEKLADQSAELLIAQADIERAEKRRDAAESAVEQKQSELDAREADLAKRESAVTAAEHVAAANSFGGGVRLVGTNTSAGVYSTGEIRGMCYYVWKTGTDANASIVDNNIVESGTATVTLNDGDVFESNGCGTWTKQS